LTEPSPQVNYTPPTRDDDDDDDDEDDEDEVLLRECDAPFACASGVLMFGCCQDEGGHMSYQDALAAAKTAQDEHNGA